ncbi:hypothetical protein SLS55_005988 [Diplodia seriata]|uniref:Uncharacterized protein n=1 Tax=Diplodia seriata TaxID=420778 RepID=A0ABR3CD02_9PEZI
MTYYATMYSFDEDSFTDDNPVFDGYHGYLNNDAKASSSRRNYNSVDLGGLELRYFVPRKRSRHWTRKSRNILCSAAIC